MDDVKMKVVDKEKDIGIIFDNTLSFEEHINSKVNKANSLVGMLRRSFVYMEKDMFKTLFVSIVRPHIEYGEAVWNPQAKKLVNSLEHVQRKGVQNGSLSRRSIIRRKVESVETTNAPIQKIQG